MSMKERLHGALSFLNVEVRVRAVEAVLHELGSPTPFMIEAGAQVLKLPEGTPGATAKLIFSQMIKEISEGG